MSFVIILHDIASRTCTHTMVTHAPTTATSGAALSGVTAPPLYRGHGRCVEDGTTRQHTIFGVLAFR